MLNVGLVSLVVPLEEKLSDLEIKSIAIFARDAVCIVKHFFY